jgi:hypothetical protein
MKTYSEYKLDQLFAEDADINLARLMGPTSALGTGTQRVDPGVLAKLRVVMHGIQDEFPDPTEALQEIIKAATMLLARTGRSMNPGTVKRKLGDRDTVTRELPGEDEEL